MVYILGWSLYGLLRIAHNTFLYKTWRERIKNSALIIIKSGAHPFLLLAIFQYIFLENPITLTNTTLNTILVFFFSLGLFIIICGHLTLKECYAPAITYKKTAHALRTTGIYSCIRHPLYLGSLIMGISFELAISWYVCLGSIVVILPLIIFQIRKEEGELAQLFEEEWKSYTQKNPYKLFPFIY